VDKDSVHAHVR